MTDIRDLDIDAVRAEETFVADAQLLLHEVMLAKRVTRAELAERLDISRARVSQIFSSECRNFTVRLLVRAMHALGETLELSCDWVRERDREIVTARVRGQIADPASNVIGLWAEDGIVVPPADRRGARKSDQRVRAVLNARAASKNNERAAQAAA